MVLPKYFCFPIARCSFLSNIPHNIVVMKSLFFGTET